ncbi:hypothetical protein AVEN_135845-1, partial [Araneus ventricosus]
LNHLEENVPLGNKMLFQELLNQYISTPWGATGSSTPNELLWDLETAVNKLIMQVDDERALRSQRQRIFS